MELRKQQLRWLCVITTFCVVFFLCFLYSYAFQSYCPYTWHGGNPKDSGFSRGSCWCGEDSYCLCTPSLAIDAIIETYDSSGEVSIVLVQRRGDPAGTLATPGGFVNVGKRRTETMLFVFYIPLLFEVINV